MASERSVGLGIESVVDLDKYHGIGDGSPQTRSLRPADNRLGLSCGNDADALAP